LYPTNQQIKYVKKKDFSENVLSYSHLDYLDRLYRYFLIYPQARAMIIKNDVKEIP
jgi:hypothetical protein